MVLVPLKITVPSSGKKNPLFTKFPVKVKVAPSEIFNIALALMVKLAILVELLNIGCLEDWAMTTFMPAAGTWLVLQLPATLQLLEIFPVHVAVEEVMLKLLEFACVSPDEVALKV
jgi:hypothetical protein